MEISLNLLWLSIVLAFASIWIFRWRPVSRARALSGATALGCALILLFPSVSVTDDLHPQILAVDAAAGKRSMSHLIVTAGRSASHGSAAASKLPAHGSVAVPPSVWALGLLVIGGIIAEDILICPDKGFISPSGRSPPALSISAK